MQKYKRRSLQAYCGRLWGWGSRELINCQREGLITTTPEADAGAGAGAKVASITSRQSEPLFIPTLKRSPQAPIDRILDVPLRAARMVHALGVTQCPCAAADGGECSLAEFRVVRPPAAAARHRIPDRKRAVSGGWQVGLLVTWVIVASAQGMAAEPDCQPAGKFISVEGVVQVEDITHSHTRAGRLEDTLCQSETIRVGANSRAAVSLINEAVLRIDQNSHIQLTDISGTPEKKSLIDLIVGAFKSFSRQPRTMALNTPYLNGMIEGTEFAMRVEGGQTTINVYEGKVRTRNEHGELLVPKGQSAVAHAGRAPEPLIVVRPRDAVQWTLYYPPISATSPVPTSISSLRDAQLKAEQGHIQEALQALDSLPLDVKEDAAARLLHAALLLNVGRAEEARRDIDSLLRQNPNQANALALRAITEVTQNDRRQALADAEKAVSISRDAASEIALSYAQQADFLIDDARTTMQQATREHPENALAWARLGELWLMAGDRRQARDAAATAQRLAPQLARTQLVFGFVALAEFDNRAAQKAFDSAIELESANPLAHFGSGLAKISDGRLAAGRHDIEAAVALDSSNALLRGYLGKAYFDEKRYPLDSQQYTLAKELDPKDPTAYLYDGILKQTVNRPVEALHDLQSAVANNYNRAVYRGRQLLDQDRAARGTSVARAYNDLGFTQLGVNEAGKSLALDPSSDSAHRFLSDTYRGARRRETSRVSELLQAQLMQDVNVNPVQPSFSETNLNIITRGGPGEAGFNEFTPLFERNTLRLNATGLLGIYDSNGRKFENGATTAGEGVISGIYDRFSVSAGAYHFNTPGWRGNNDINHDIYNVFTQTALTPELNIQAEYRHRESYFGDLEFNYDPNSYERNARNKLKQDMARVGLRYSPASHSDFLFSYIHGNRDESQSNPSAGSLAKALVNNDAEQADAQYIFKHERFNVITGFSYTHVGEKAGVGFDIPSSFSQKDNDRSEANDYRGYIYTNIKWPQAVTWTLGLSAVSFEEKTRRSSSLFVNVPPTPASLTNSDARFSNIRHRVNPKFGVQWDLTDSIRLRGFYAQTVKQPLAANRTLEPTQIAGFNQFFDNANATPSSRYGVGLNWQITRDLSLGGEATWREIKEPNLTPTPSWVFDPARESWHQAYLYWTPTEQWAVRGAFVYDQYEKKSDALSVQSNITLPLKVETYSVPLNATYFHPSGFFASTGVTFVDQTVKKIVTPVFPNLPQGRNSFAVVDLGLGYRMPNRWGIVSIFAQNLFDERFNYQDDSFREFSNEPSTGPYYPARTIMGRMTLNF